MRCDTYMEVATQVKNKNRSRKKNSTELHTSSSIGWIFFPLVLLLFHISDRIVVICMRTYFQEASRHTRFLCVYFIKTVVVVVVFFFSFFSNKCKVEPLFRCHYNSSSSTSSPRTLWHVFECGNFRWKTKFWQYSRCTTITPSHTTMRRKDNKLRK